MPEQSVLHSVIDQMHATGLVCEEIVCTDATPRMMQIAKRTCHCSSQAQQGLYAQSNAISRGRRGAEARYYLDSNLHMC